MDLYGNAHQHLHPSEVMSRPALHISGKIWPALCLSVLFLASCGGKDRVDRNEASGSVPTEDVERIYRLFLDGNYKEYVAAMHSCDNRPDNYRKQMEDICRAHAEERGRNSGKPIGFTVARTVSSPDGLSAEAFLNVSYADGEVEEVYLQFVRVDGIWRLR